MKLTIRIPIAVYAAVALFTFGRSASDARTWHNNHCRTPSERFERGDKCYTSPAVYGLFSGALWPLYWSWELQTPSTPREGE
jgi:hypothetical protein